MDKLKLHERELLSKGIQYHVAIFRSHDGQHYTAWAPELDYLFWGASVEDIAAQAPANMLDTVLFRAECDVPFALPHNTDKAREAAVQRMKRDPETVIKVTVASRQSSSGSERSEAII